MALKLDLGNPEVGVDGNILDIEIPKEMQNNIPTGIKAFDVLCAGDGCTPSSVIFLTGIPGSGKCFSKGTEVIMYNGKIKKVEDVVVGDELMGPDSKPRKVLSLASGVEEMFEINPVKGESWRCNRSHTLSLLYSGKNTISNITVDEYLKLGNGTRERLKQYSSGFIKFKSKNTNLDPYFVGLWLGDGTVGEAHITNQDDQVIEFVEQYAEKLNMRCNKTSYSKTRIQRLAIVSKKLRSHEKNIVKDTLMKDHYINGEKRISSMYLLNTKQVRLDVLAGLIDTDGYLSKFACAQIMTKYDGLKEDILFLARSLGFAAYASKLTKTIKSLNFSGEYWAVNISGDLSEVPCKITYKKAKPRKQIKNVLRTGITVKSIGQGEYFGFAVDGDHLFLLKNFTVVHNSTFTLQIADSVRGTGNISLLNTCEESLYQVRKTITRLGLKNGFIPSYKSEAHDLIEHAEKVRLAHPGKQMFLFVDSLQTIEFDTKKGGRPMSQQNAAVEATYLLTSWAKKTFSVVIIIGQVTKDGTMAGKQEIKHAIDVHMHLGMDTDKRSDTYGQRIAEIQKNRFGTAGIYLEFNLTSAGLQFPTDTSTTTK